MKTRDRKKRDAEILGMPFGTAQSKLYKALILELAQQVGSKAQCLYCRGWISDPEDLAIEHLQSWRQLGANTFWDLKNVALRHKGCSKPHTPRLNKMQHVQVTVEDLSGRQLKAFTDENGKMHIAGVHGDAYQLRIRNTTRNNVEVVTTVDGRDVCSGEKGDTNARGYMVHGHDDLVIKGFRRSQEEVAQFLFSPNGDSYSSQMGTPENVGVIGVAVFKQYQVPVINYRSTGFPSGGFIGSDSGSPSYTNDQYTSCNTSGTQYGDVATAGPACAPDGMDVKTSGVNLNTMDGERSRSSSRMQRGPMTRKRTTTRQDLGTQYGKKVSSSVQSVSFTRDSETPTETLVISYDTLNAIMGKGRMQEVSQITGEPFVVDGPNPFPKNQVSSEYAQPPPGYRG